VKPAEREASWTRRALIGGLRRARFAARLGARRGSLGGLAAFAALVMLERALGRPRRPAWRGRLAEGETLELRVVARPKG
jgi:hypothetical protein